MKKLYVLFLAVLLLVCACSKKDLPPELTVGESIRHNSGEQFYIEDYCKVKSHSGGKVNLSYTGDVDVNVYGDYEICVTADDEFGGKVSKDVVVTIQENRSELGNDVACKNLKEFIMKLQQNGCSNIGFIDYAEGFGNMAEAVSADGSFTHNDTEGNMIFEAYHLENKKFSAFNMIFVIGESEMWYVPQKVTLLSGDTSIGFEVKEEISSGGVYGFYVAIDEFGDKIAKTVPDYAYLEQVRNIANSEESVVLQAAGASGTYEIELSDKQKKDFRDIFMVYEEMLTYY